MPDITTERFIMTGAKDFIMKKLNEAKTGYETDKIQFLGLVTITATHTQTITQLAAEDDPSFIKEKSALTADLEIVFRGVPDENLAILTNAITKQNGEIGYGNMEGEVPEFGIAWKKNDGKLKKQYNRVYFDMPNDNSISIGEDGDRNLTLTAHASPVTYVKTDGKTVHETFHTNKLGDANWATVKDDVIFPDEGSTVI